MHLPPLIQDLAIILGVAAIVTFLFRRIKQPVVLGYVFAGIIVGPFTPPLLTVADHESVKIWAELGVIFLMFSLGLEFSFRRLAKVGMSASITAAVQIAAMLVFGVITAKALNWSSMDAIFLGCMIAISSTTIIIKSFEELGLKNKRFAELVFGILIVEDLAAILMLVALTNISTTDTISSIDLLFAGGKMAIVVGAWFLVGMFVVPRFVAAVARHGTDEMLVVVSIALCLGLVTLSAAFHYSVALGAFIMGSILAESTESRRIEHLVQPLKDIFGAVFFVSVGMLLDPHTIIDNLGAVTLISAVIILGNLGFVTLGALATGQTIKTSVQTGFSMAQIGEFSFIIATLGLTYKVINPKLYPIIVAASLITTLTTPYLIKASPAVAAWIENSLPARLRTLINDYTAYIRRRSITSERSKQRYRNLATWGLNAVAVITGFVISADKLIPLLQQHFTDSRLPPLLAWVAAFVVTSPCIWGMLTVFNDKQARIAPSKFLAVPRDGALFLSRLAVIFLVGFLSVQYFPALIALGITVCVGVLITYVFRRQLESYYRWVEHQFESGFQGDSDPEDKSSFQGRLAPWDAHLAEVMIPARSFVVGKSLLELKLRETHGLNVVVIMRGDEAIVAPRASESLYPNDVVLCFATDPDIERFRQDVSASPDTQNKASDLKAYSLRRFVVSKSTELIQHSIRESGIRELYDCIVVGLERHSKRIPSPTSDIRLEDGDILWIVGGDQGLEKLRARF